MIRVQWISHKGKNILFMDCTGCSAEELVKVADKSRRIISARPHNSVLTLGDLTGAKITREAVEHIQKILVLNRPFVKRSALVGAESLPPVLLKSMIAFSQRQLPTFPTREEAMDWLVSEEE